MAFSLRDVLFLVAIICSALSLAQLPVVIQFTLFACCSIPLRFVLTERVWKFWVSGGMWGIAIWYMIFWVLLVAWQLIFPDDDVHSSGLWHWTRFALPQACLLGGYAGFLYLKNVDQNEHSP